jgi:hypothetical protein
MNKSFIEESNRSTRTHNYRRLTRIKDPLPSTPSDPLYFPYVWRASLCDWMLPIQLTCPTIQKKKKNAQLPKYRLNLFFALSIT